MIPCLITTSERGVFFGHVKPEDMQSIPPSLQVEGMRAVYSWSSPADGVFSLATDGPQRGSKVGPVVARAALTGITSVCECSPKAVAAFAAAKWARE